MTKVKNKKAEYFNEGFNTEKELQKLNNQINFFNSLFVEEIDRYQRKILIFLKESQNQGKHARGRPRDSDLYKRQGLLKKKLLESVSEIGCKFPKFGLQKKKNKLHFQENPEIKLLIPKRKSIVDIRELIWTFVGKPPLSPKQFYKSLLSNKHNILFLNTHCVLRLFWVILNPASCKKKIEFCQIFTDSRNFINLFFLVQLFGFRTLNLGMKFLESKFY